MSRIVEITLARPRIVSLVERLQTLANSPGIYQQPEAARTEMKQLLALFDAAFTETGVIKIDEAAAPAILRASALLRLQLRVGPLASVPDTTIEAGLDPELYSSTEQVDVACFEFLLQLQSIVLDNFDASCFRSNIVGWTTPNLFYALRSLFTSGDSCQVVLNNDPVNGMRYVALALRSELNLPEAVAEKHAQEVHAAKRSIVWTGSRARAEARIRVLRAWHLDAVLKT